jgi:CHAT domain-containing protein
MDTNGGVVLVVGPTGQKVRGFELQWPKDKDGKGKPVTRETLSKAVEQYLTGIKIDGLRSRGLTLRGLSEESLKTRGVTRVAVRSHTADSHSAIGYRLFEALIPDAVRKELMSAELVYVVPDGAMHKLAFESLLTESPAPDATTKERTYWLDNGPAIIYGPSATVLVNRAKARDQQLKRLSKGHRPKRQATLLGAPIFESLSSSKTNSLAAVSRSGYLTRFGGVLAPLPGTRREVEAIRSTLLAWDVPTQMQCPEESVTLLGKNATRTQLFEQAAGSRYLHLATHGLTDTTDKAVYTSLALTRPAVITPKDFGFLTLMDLFDNWCGRLGDTELVVLSACDTQRGRIDSGEGVFGISWGFMYAGAPAVVASLWQVNDASTADLMATFYRQVTQQQTKNGGKLRAFVAARKALRKSHPQPYFWAPFIYMGDPR